MTGVFMRWAVSLGWLCLLAAPTAAAVATPATPATSAMPATGERTTAAPLDPGQAIAPAELERFVDGVVRDAMAAEHLAGVSVAVVQGGKISLLKGYGIGGVNPIRPIDPYRTRFRIASTSKTFTWTLLLREVERGRIRLEDRVNDHLPPEMRFSDKGFQRPIRIVDLMAHAAGFEDNDLANAPATDRQEKIGTLRDYLIRHKPKRVREPGLFSTYSNYGVALAGYIVERASGMDVATLAERELFAPLKMNDSTFREPYAERAGLPSPMSAELRSRLVTDFRWNGFDFLPSKIEYLNAIGPAGSISMTPADMARYMQMHLGGGSLDGTRIYGAKTASLLRTPIMNVPDDINGWAHGLMISALPGGFKGYGHGGAGIASLNYMTWVPELDLGIFVITNTNTGAPLVFRFADLLVGEFYGPRDPARLPYDPAAGASLKPYEGYYVSTRRSYRGLSQFLDLMGTAIEVSANEAGYLQTSNGSTGQRWVPVDGSGRFREVNGRGRMVFATDASGRPDRYTTELGLQSMERAGLALDPRLFGIAALLTVLGALGVVIRTIVHRKCAGAWVSSPAARGLVVVSMLWLAAFVAFGGWIATLVEEDLLFTWPGALLPVAAGSALLATVAAALLVAGLLWQLVRRPLQRNRRALVSITLALIYLGFGVLVGIRGGLSPWY